MSRLPLVEEYDPKTADRLLKLGTAVRLAAMTPLRSIAMGELCERVWPAIRLDQVAFLNHKVLGVCAYASWAYFSEVSLAEFRRSWPAPFPDENWNDGDMLCIVDFVSPFGTARELKRLLWNEFRKTRDYVLGIRTSGPSPPRISKWRVGSAA